MQTYKLSRSFWPRVDWMHSRELLRLTKEQLYNLGRFLLVIGIHAMAHEFASNSFCRSCFQVEVESSQHFLLRETALSGIRFRHLVSEFFAAPTYIAGLKITHLVNYISSLKLLMKMALTTVVGRHPPIHPPLPISQPIC